MAVHQSKDRTEQATVEKQKDSSLGVLQVDRRSLLSVALRNLWRIAEAPVLIGPFIFSSALLSDKFSGVNGTVPEIDRNKPDSAPFSTIDIRLQIQSGGGFRSLGVKHDVNQFLKEGQHIRSAMSEADIVLLEGGSRDDSHKYFTMLRDEALAQGKLVYNIDMARKDLAAWSGIVSNSIGAAAGTALLLDFRREERNGRTLGFKRRSLLRGLGFAGVMLGFPSAPAITGLVRDKYPSLDVAYVSDGRTVKMLDNVLKAIQNHPGKRIVAITGDQHAIGMVHYLSSPESFRRFERRRAVYFRTYEHVFGREMTQL